MTTGHFFATKQNNTWTIFLTFFVLEPERKICNFFLTRIYKFELNLVFSYFQRKKNGISLINLRAPLRFLIF